MKPTEELLQEHTAIRTMLGILESACQQIDTGRAPNPADLEKMLEFLKVFADKCHHAKEEQYLFPAMERAGMPKEQGPIGVMLAEHDLGRTHVRSMVKELERYKAGEKTALQKFAREARGYAQLLDQHIEKENQILFPLAERILSGEDLEHLSTDFERMEIEVIGSGRHEMFHAWLRELKEVYPAQS